MGAHILLFKSSFSTSFRFSIDFIIFSSTLKISPSSDTLLKSVVRSYSAFELYSDPSCLSGPNLRHKSTFSTPLCPLCWTFYSVLFAQKQTVALYAISCIKGVEQNIQAIIYRSCWLQNKNNPVSFSLWFIWKIYILSLRYCIYARHSSPPSSFGVW